MPFYLKNPVWVEALQWTGGNWGDMCLFAPVPEKVRGEDDPCDEHMDLIVTTAIGDMRANLGDYIVKERGFYYPVKQDTFEQNYERVAPEAPASKGA